MYTSIYKHICTYIHLYMYIYVHIIYIYIFFFLLRYYLCSKLYYSIFLLVYKVAKFCLNIHQSNNTKFYSVSFLSLAIFVQVCLLSSNVLTSLTRSMITLIY